MIRQATAEDAAAIASVQIASWNETYPGLLPDDFIAERTYEKSLLQWNGVLRGSHGVFIYELNKEIVGFVDSGPIKQVHLPYPGELYALHVLGKYHKQGIGKILFEHAKTRLVDSHLFPFIALVLTGNPALAFYQKMGATIIGEQFAQYRETFIRDIQLGWGVA